MSDAISGLLTRPTRIRYLVVLVAMFAAVLLYLERVCLSVADVYVREDLRIGKTQMDWAFAAFFIAYAFGQVPSGWLSQRYGPRLMMALYMLGWSVFGIFIALAQDFWTLFIARFLLGLSQAGAYPTAALLVKRWMPDEHRGLASSIVAFGGRFGGAGANWLTGILIVAFVPFSTPATVSQDQILNPTPIVSPTPSQLEDQAKNPALDPVRDAIREQLSPTASEGQITDTINRLIADPDPFPTLDWQQIKLAADANWILAKPAEERSPQEFERLHRLLIDKAFPGAIRQLHTNGWRPTLLLYGMLGIIVGGLFYVLTRNWPREHPWANKEEVEFIEKGQSKIGEQTGTDAIPYKELLKSKNQWLFSTNQFFSNVGWVFLISLMPRFLEERYQVPVDLRGMMTTMPLFAAALFMPVGGWFTDWLTRRRGRRIGRAVPMGAFKIPCAVALASCPWLPGPWAVTAALAFMAVCQDFGIAATWAFAQDTAGKQVGAVLGWANMWGNFGAGLAIIMTGRIAELIGWDAAFYAIALAFALSGLTGLLANASQNLFPATEESQS